jgi:hypothetical protein
MTWREHDNRAPALLAAAALHVGLFGLLLIAPKAMPLPPVGSSVPINIVSTDPYTDSRPAVQAPQTQAAAALTPVPKAQPQPPAQVAAPPAFSAAPKTKPQHEKPVPAQASLHPTKPSDSSPDLLNHLQSIIANAQRTAGPPASSAQKGPPRQETAARARPNAGQGVMQSDIVGLDQLLGRLWNPNCEAPGGADVRFPAKFKVDLNGAVGHPDLGGLEDSSNPVIAAAARRAIAAIHQVEPYDPKFRGQTITANFNAKEGCSKR